MVKNIHKILIIKILHSSLNKFKFLIFSKTAEDSHFCDIGKLLQ